MLMTAPRALVRLVAVVLLVAAVGACGRPPHEPPAPSGQTLLTWEDHGGNCREPSLCAPVTVTIARDGAWTFHQDTVDRTGRLDDPTRDRLVPLVDTATGTLAALPPSTECPENYDGQNIRIVFRPAGRPVGVTNCDRDARPGDLVRTLDAGNALIDATRETVSAIHTVARPYPGG
jgi:hypothetical protein